MHFTIFQVIAFSFPSCEKLHPPVIQVQHVSFKYLEEKVRRGRSADGDGSEWENIITSFHLILLSCIWNEKKCQHFRNLPSFGVP